MIFGPVHTRNPFADDRIFWCEAPFGVGDVTGLSHDAGPLGQVEAHLPDHLFSAVPKRRSEFLAGRLCASLALRQAGLPEAVAQDGRTPVWPQGVTGSITHSRNRAIAVVSTEHKALGIDCEAMVPHDRATQLCSAIFTEAEARHCPPGLAFPTFFTLVFSAKEALYKAMSPRLSRIPAFLDVTLTDMTRHDMRLVLDGQPHRARFLLSHHDCVTLVAE